jgi:pectate lyase
VTSLAELNAALAGTAPAVIWVEGNLSGDVKVGSNKSIVGVCGAQLHGHVEVAGSANVILRNLKIVGYGVGNCALDPSYDPAVGCSSGSDAISVWKKSHHVWIDHCDISDGTDGNLDITQGSDDVTVSWTKFHYTDRTDDAGSDSTGASGHRFSNLVGGTDTPSAAYDDAHALNVTWHHDWWADGVVERQPRVRFGKNHVFNNLFTSASSKYCVRAGIDAHLLVEGNVFDGVTDPEQFNSTSDQATASITAVANLYTNISGSEVTGGGGTAFVTPPYGYTAEPTDALEAAIQAGAGPH